MYDERIANMLGYKSGQSNDHASETYVNAAKSCRDVRERMELTKCRATISKEECVYIKLLPLLDTLQRRAYASMKHSFVELSQMHKEYMAAVSAKFQEIEELIEDSSKEVAAQDRWWESTNIFNGSTFTLACATIPILDLLRIHPKPIETSLRTESAEFCRLRRLRPREDVHHMARRLTQRIHPRLVP